MEDYASVAYMDVVYDSGMYIKVAAGSPAHYLVWTPLTHMYTDEYDVIITIEYLDAAELW